MTLSKYEQDIIDNVARHGWQCTSVFDPEDAGPNFSYSIGFWETICTPELIIFGLEIELMHSLLWMMYRRLKDGAKLADGARWPDLIEGFDCITRPVHPSQVKIDYLNSAIWYHHRRTGTPNVPVFQLFWPGALDGLFPWEKGADDAVRALQPLLYLPDEPGNA